MFRGMGFIKALRPDLHVNGYVPGKHFDAAYRKGDDKLGYSFEYRIPWDTCSGTPTARGPPPGPNGPTTGSRPTSWTTSPTKAVSSPTSGAKRW